MEFDEEAAEILSLLTHPTTNTQIDICEEIAQKSDTQSGQREWQPIESAPKDGTPIRLYDPEYDDEEMNSSLDGHWSDGAHDDQGGFQAAVWDNSQDYFATVDVNPTHWTPLPKPPAIRTGGEA